MTPSTPQNLDPRDSSAQNPSTGDAPRHPGAPEPVLDRGFGDEHGGYLIQPEEDEPEPGLPGVNPVPGARP